MRVTLTRTIKDRDELNALRKQFGKEYEIELQGTVLTRQQKKELREYLYNTLMLIATERDEFYPCKSHSLATLMESFFYWASEYNDGYFSERDNNDWIGKYLVEQYDFFY